MWDRWTKDEFEQECYVIEFGISNGDVRLRLKLRLNERYGKIRDS